MFIFIILLILILGYKIKLKKRIETADEYIDRTSGTGIKGICALVVALNHIAGGYFPDWFGKMSYLCVGIFFFYSGYGVMRSLCVKGDSYCKNFLKNRVLFGTLFIFIISNCFYLLFRITVSRDEMALLDVLLYLFGIKLINPTAWYVPSIIIFYLVFYFSARYTKRQNVKYAILMFYIVYTLFCVGIDIGTWWYISSIGFIIGLLFAEYTKVIFYYIKKHYWILIVISLCGFLLSYALMLYAGKSGRSVILHISTRYLITGLNMISIPFFLVLFILLIMKFSFQNKILMFIGSISYELYLIHILCVWIVNFVVGTINSAIFTIACTSLSIAVAYVLGNLNKIVKKKKVLW